MIEVHEYRCEYCNAVFDDEDTCAEHEWEHLLDEVRDSISVYDYTRTKITLTPKSVENVWYVKWESKAAIMRFIELSEGYCGCYDIFPFEIEEKNSGKIFYDETDNRWHDVEEKRRELQKLLKVFQN